MNKRIADYHRPRPLLLQRYNDMKRRTQGKPAGDRRSQLWLGLPIMPQDEFLSWAINDPDFQACYEAWKADNFQRRTAPTAHRINRTDGYVAGNIKWVPHAEKSRQHLAQGKKTQRARRASANPS